MSPTALIYLHTVDEAAAHWNNTSQKKLWHPESTAPPLAWLTLLAALQGRDDYDTRLRAWTRSGPPTGHPDRPRPRPDPVGQGDRAAAGETPSAPFITSAGSDSPCWHGWPRPSASTQRYELASPTWAAGGSRSSLGSPTATGRPWALATVAYGRAMTADAGDAAEALFAGCVGPPPRAGRPWTKLAPTSPTGSGCVAPNGASTPANTCATPWRPSATCTPSRSSTARPKSCAPQARPPASATPPHS